MQHVFNDLNYDYQIIKSIFFNLNFCLLVGYHFCRHLD